MNRIALSAGVLTLMAIAMATTAGRAMAATATANVSATILTPISISKSADLSYGDVYPDISAAGTVTVDSSGGRTTSGGVALGATTGSAATFVVSGQASVAYTVTLPTAPVTLTSGGNSMTADSFTTDGTGTLSAGGSESINVGATLTVGGGQPAGSYTGNFDVVVNYN